MNYTSFSLNAIPKLNLFVCIGQSFSICLHRSILLHLFASLNPSLFVCIAQSFSICSLFVNQYEKKMFYQFLLRFFLVIPKIYSLIHVEMQEFWLNICVCFSRIHCTVIHWTSYLSFLGKIWCLVPCIQLNSLYTIFYKSWTLTKISYYSNKK
jgi:hypothetical protein